MIITMFKGRLGNQLFQYAAAKKMALKNNTELKLDLSNMPYESPYGPEHNNAYALQFFNISAPIATPQEVALMRKRDLAYYLRRTFRTRANRRFVWEKNWLIDQDILTSTNDHAYVRGMFQSPAYFQGIEDIIRKEFTLKVNIESKYQRIFEMIRTTNSVSVHIRRGDITVGDLRFYHHNMGIEYYKKALHYMRSNISDPRFFIFSDDIEWARTHLGFITPAEFVSGKGMLDYEELIIMSKCKNNIIGNSTFSWWAAWLNSNRDKIIISPKHWFIDPKKDVLYVQNLIPPSWITM